MNAERVATDGDLVRRILSEYLEMPGLRLTRAQAQRLWGLDAPTCVKLLDSLVDLKFLMYRPDGRYTRLTDGGIHPGAGRHDPSVRHSSAP
jgi:hypothetical protein